MGERGLVSGDMLWSQKTVSGGKKPRKRRSRTPRFSLSCVIYIQCDAQGNEKVPSFKGIDEKRTKGGFPAASPWQQAPVSKQNTVQIQTALGWRRPERSCWNQKPVTWEIRGRRICPVLFIVCVEHAFLDPSFPWKGVGCEQLFSGGSGWYVALPKAETTNSLILGLYYCRSR